MNKEKQENIRPKETDKPQPQKMALGKNMSPLGVVGELNACSKDCAELLRRSASVMVAFNRKFRGTDERRLKAIEISQRIMNDVSGLERSFIELRQTLDANDQFFDGEDGSVVPW